MPFAFPRLPQIDERSGTRQSSGFSCRFASGARDRETSAAGERPPRRHGSFRRSGSACHAPQPAAWQRPRRAPLHRPLFSVQRFADDTVGELLRSDRGVSVPARRAVVVGRPWRTGRTAGIHRPGDAPEAGSAGRPRAHRMRGQRRPDQLRPDERRRLGWRAADFPARPRPPVKRQIPRPRHRLRRRIDPIADVSAGRQLDLHARRSRTRVSRNQDERRPAHAESWFGWFGRFAGFTGFAGFGSFVCSASARSTNGSSDCAFSKRPCCRYS